MCLSVVSVERQVRWANVVVVVVVAGASERFDIVRVGVKRAELRLLSRTPTRNGVHLRLNFKPTFSKLHTLVSRFARLRLRTSTVRNVKHDEFYPGRRSQQTRHIGLALKQVYTNVRLWF